MNENSSENIIKRLEKLRLWQEEQQKLLINRQNNQREQLGIEQQKMYELLGLSSLPSSSPVSNDQQEFNEESSIIIQDNDLIEEENYIEKRNFNTNKSIKNGNDAGGIFNNENNNPNEENRNVEKRPFLKRGQGLQNRFKVDPNVFRLNNLPKYKYANTHRKYSQKNSKMTNTNSEIEKVKKPPIESTNFLPKMKLKLEMNNKPKTDNLNEQNKNSNIIDSNLSNNNPSDDSKQSFEKINPISWAKVLDPNNSEPISVKEFRYDTSSTSLLDSKFGDNTDNLSIFELLEQKAQEGNFSLNASNIRKWIQEKAMELVKETEAAVAEDAAIENIKKSKISPFPCDINAQVIPDEEEESSYSSDEQSVTEDDDYENIVNKQNDQHVRFNEEVQINEVLSETETVDSIEAYHINTETTNDKSDFERFKANLYTGNDTTISETTLINTSSQSIENINGQQHRKIITDKSELLKKRLADLEIEISTFKKHNTELIKFKQDHELQKISLEEERIEMEEKINDEKIKFEIYMHDERMKIEDEKKKLEKLIKDQRIPNRKERDEITKLREQVENLQQDCKTKEGKHISAQARLRAQIRNLEKEVKDLSFEIEHLKKENKKLESENAQLNRQNNNKMLQEINKTIAKLAPKPAEPPPATEIQNRNLKPVTAKVISHKRHSQNKSKSNTNLNLITENYNSALNDDDEEVYLGTSTSEDEEKTNYRRKPRKSSKKLDNIKKSSENINNENPSRSYTNNNKCSMNFKREIQNFDGSKDIWYPNGNLKKISADGMFIKMLYFNKDIKETNISEGTIKYYYAETNTWHTTYLDGLEILEFPNGQTEHRYKDGTIEVHFPNGSIRISNPMDENKTEEWRYSDGTNLIQLKSGDKILSLPNGQKEIHTKIHKRREYPDGTVKIVYPDGSQETRYSNGRVRLKDKDGILVMDSDNIKY